MKTLSHIYRHACTPASRPPTTSAASNIEKSTIDIKKEVRGVAGDHKKQYTKVEVQACSIDAMINGGECEACQ
jgi:ribonucleoside-diphosphate reductase alpha chain